MQRDPLPRSKVEGARGCRLRLPSGNVQLMLVEGSGSQPGLQRPEMELIA